jgi:hypothetical protein
MTLKPNFIQSFNEKLKESLDGFDLLRGIFFLRINRINDTLEALREELHFFPCNQKAHDFLNQVQQRNPEQTAIGIIDDEFHQLLRLI